MKHLLVGLAFLFALGTEAWALSLTLTDGDLGGSVRNEFSPVVTLIGDNFRFGAGPPISGNITGPFVHSEPSVFPAGPINLSTTAEVIRGTLTLNGATYTNVGGAFQFTTPTFQLSGAGDVSAPFTMVGTLDAQNISLTGQGTVTARVDRAFTDLFFVDRIVYSFSPPQAAPVIPEPSSVLLVASGLAGLGLWRRQSLKHHVT
jgi:hypothetical protein